MNRRQTTLILAFGLTLCTLTSAQPRGSVTYGSPQPGLTNWTVHPCRNSGPICKVPIKMSFNPDGSCNFNSIPNFIEFERGKGYKKIKFEMANGTGPKQFKLHKAGPQDDAIEITSGTDFEIDSGAGSDDDQRHLKLAASGANPGNRYNYYDIWVHYRTASGWLPCDSYGPGIFNRD